MNKIKVMIVSRPGSWQQILVFHVNTFPIMDVQDIVSGGLTAYETLLNSHPDVILIDSSISLEDAMALIVRAKSINRQSQIIAIVDTDQHRKRLGQCNADYIVSSYALESELNLALRDIENNQLDLRKVI